MSNPYRGLPDHQFWRRSVSGVEHHLLDPVVAPRFKIDREERVATAGSCFAQHISRRLSQIGFNYFVTEAGEGLSEAERHGRNYGTFSARYGNLYTTAQLLQLFQEAFGQRQPLDRVLQKPDGRYVDIYRQQIDEEGFSSPAEAAAERALHLAAVRKMFTECDVFVFTLGLTEAWRSLKDGSVVPVAPGVIGGSFDPAKYEFRNFTVDEVREDLEAFLSALRAINPGVKVLLTVSPVPLIATYENRHVLVSTTYSKAVLRVVAEQVMQGRDWVDYFPSYEIITGSYAGGLYYENDHREVNHLGVAHAMRCFLNNYVDKGDRRATVAAPDMGGSSSVICDEEVLAQVR
jgi:hypothetical protein